MDHLRTRSHLMQASGWSNVSLIDFPAQQHQAALNPTMSCLCELLAALLHLYIWLGCMQVATCHHLQHLNLSQCVGLTDAGIAALGTAPAVTSGRCAAEANIRFLLALNCRKIGCQMLRGHVQMAGWNDPESTTSASSLALTTKCMSAFCLGCAELSACPVNCPATFGLWAFHSRPTMLCLIPSLRAVLTC